MSKIRMSPTELSIVNDLPEMDVTDEGTTWDWKCDLCGKVHKEDGDLAADDMLICDECGLKYRWNLRNIPLIELEWVATIKYQNYPDSTFRVSAYAAPDILTALGHVQRHVQECWPYEIISLVQRKY